MIGGVRWPSQDLTDPAGSILRFQDDGSVVEDNPFVGQSPGNLRPEIYSFGHRNNQALTLHPDDGSLWTAEHGPYGGDLVHIVADSIGRIRDVRQGTDGFLYVATDDEDGGIYRLEPVN